jgi:hypothetical protein
MKVFVCSRTIDKAEVDVIVKELFRCSENAVAVLREITHSNEWKKQVEQKFKEVDFVIFLLGKDTFTSDQLKWEYAKAKQLNKQIVGIKLSEASNESILYCQGFLVFDNPEQCYKSLLKIFEADQKLKLEQYKIMVGSTEKVTEQRLKVNNLFFTVTSSILSVAFVLGKTFGFTVGATIGMFILTLLAFLVTFFWEKLIHSYGNLNRGKFIVIDKIEKQLRTNMFEDEWNILTNEIKYEPNTKTEATVIKRFRLFIAAAGICELAFLAKQLYNSISIYN